VEPTGEVRSLQVPARGRRRRIHLGRRVERSGEESSSCGGGAVGEALPAGNEVAAGPRPASVMILGLSEKLGLSLSEDI
jgi:hypothetical protein